MNVTLTDPTGLNYYIQRFQTALYTDVMRKYSGGSVKWNAYGRCNRNLKNGQYVAEVFKLGSKGEYIDPLTDDKVDITSFFGTSSLINDRTRQMAKVHLLVFCNLKRLKPLTGWRADEEVRTDFLRVIGKCLYGFHLDSTETGIDNVLKEYRGSALSLKANADMQPWHCFRLNFSLAYNPNHVPLKL